IHAVGLDQILARVGVTKTTFYNHFESKDALACDALELRAQYELKALTRDIRERAGGDPRQALIEFFNLLDDWFNDERFEGCLFINAAAEFPAPHDPVHQAAARYKVQAESMLEELAREAGAAD